MNGGWERPLGPGPIRLTMPVWASAPERPQGVRPPDGAYELPGMVPAAAPRPYRCSRASAPHEKGAQLSHYISYFPYVCRIIYYYIRAETLRDRLIYKHQVANSLDFGGSADDQPQF